MDGDATYFEGRAQQEREAAMKSPHASARKAHIEMARRYHELHAAIVARKRLSGRGTRHGTNAVGGA